MEPFALFNLLSSLLSQNPTLSNGENDEATPPLPTEEIAPAPALDKENSQAPTLTQNAVLSFLSAHDARAKRTKKP